MVKILILLTSHQQLGDTGKTTGFYFDELATPYYAFADAGYDVTLASMKGAAAPYDPTSVAKVESQRPTAVRRFLADAEAMQKLSRTIPLEKIVFADYDAIFLPGGHGTMWDLATSELLGQRLTETYARGAIIAAVCHGPAGLLHAKAPDGRPLVAGRAVNAFTNEEEAEAGLTKVVPFALETRLRELGARFESSPRFTAHVVRDGQLITGQNPVSAGRVAESVVDALSTKLGDRRRPVGPEVTALVPELSTAMLLAQPENRALADLVYDARVTALHRGKRVAILTTDGVEEIELTATRDYFSRQGASVHVVAPRKPSYPTQFGVQIPDVRETHVLTIRYIAVGGWIRFDRHVDDVRADDYDVFVIPGGAWNPDTLRADPKVLELLRSAAKSGKVIAAICHGPWVLGDAGLLAGRRATAWWSMQQDVRGSGATYVDAPVVVDGQIITSRAPIDLPAFLEAISNKLGVSAKEDRRAKN